MRKLSDINIRNKTIALRVDLNVPVDKFIVLDESRIAAILPTIKYCLQQGASVILCSHLGRPNGKNVEELRNSFNQVFDEYQQSIISQNQLIRTHYMKFVDEIYNSFISIV